MRKIRSGRGGRRPGAGRPRLLAKPTIAATKIGVAEIRRLDAIARCERSNRSEILRRAIRSTLIAGRVDGRDLAPSRDVKNVYVKLEARELAMIEDLAARLDLSRSAVIRGAIRRALRIRTVR